MIDLRLVVMFLLVSVLLSGVIYQAIRQSKEFSLPMATLLKVAFLEPGLCSRWHQTIAATHLQIGHTWVPIKRVEAFWGRRLLCTVFQKAILLAVRRFHAFSLHVRMHQFMRGHHCFFPERWDRSDVVYIGVLFIGGEKNKHYFEVLDEKHEVPSGALLLHSTDEKRPLTVRSDCFLYFELTLGPFSSNARTLRKKLFRKKELTRRPIVWE